MITEWNHRSAILCHPCVSKDERIAELEAENAKLLKKRDDLIAANASKLAALLTEHGGKKKGGDQ